MKMLGICNCVGRSTGSNVANYCFRITFIQKICNSSFTVIFRKYLNILQKKNCVEFFFIENSAFRVKFYVIKIPSKRNCYKIF